MPAEPPDSSPDSLSGDQVADLGASLELDARVLTPAAVLRVLRRAFAALQPRDAVLTSGFGMEGCALIDMIAGSRLPLRIAFLDTGFHFAETLELQGRLARRYPQLDFETLTPALSPAEQAQREGPELWLRAPDRCCGLRKIEPLEKRLQAADLWLSAVTRSQSESRAELPVLSPDSRFGVPKLSPLLAWNRAEIWRYVKAHQVPFHPLHLRGYPTLGCTHCTLPVPGAGPADYSRAGRWVISAKTECGLHDRAGAPEPSTLETSPTP